MSEDFISGLHDDLVEGMDRYERRSPRGRLAAGAYLQLLRPATGARVAAGAAIIVALVTAVLTVTREADVQRPAAPPSTKSVIDVRSGIKFSLDGRVLTVHLLQSASSHTVRRLSGARTSATCGANGDSPPNDSGATTLTQHWPTGQMSLSYRFRRDVSDWCRLEDSVGRSVSFVVFPGASPGWMESINYLANDWLRYPTMGLDLDGGACPRGMNQGACAAIWRDAAVQEIAIKGDRATVRFSNGKTIELHREANGGLIMNPPFAGDRGVAGDQRRLAVDGQQSPARTQGRGFFR